MSDDATYHGEGEYPPIPSDKILADVGRPLEAVKQELDNQLSKKLISQMEKDGVSSQQSLEDELDDVQMLASDLLYIKTTLALQNEMILKVLEEQRTMYDRMLVLLLRAEKNFSKT